MANQSKHFFSRLAAAAALACAGTAAAQSAVTVYGVADVAVGKVTGQSTRLFSSATQNNGTSRWGLRGTEDLGGGLKASFNLEAEIGMLNGAAAANLFARAANLGLSGGFGTVRAGRALTPSWTGVMAWELTASANYAVVNSQFGYGGAGSRDNAILSYTTPTWGGLSITAGHILAGNNNNLSKTDLNLIYRSGPLSASLVYNKVEKAKRNWAAGARYQFDGFALAGSVQDARGGARGKGFTIGGSMPLGASTVTLDLARDTVAKDTDVVLELKYPLSKRTMVYGVLLRNGAGKAATDVNSTVLGVRHNF
ncbi:MAG: porin [Burkholderiaceae bacterium]|nr:porin [Burkholderiaceae bacterium]